jgi:NADH-quinone oxidoreductase subunit M
MHNRQGERPASREMGVGDALVIVPLVLVIIAFALYPQGALRASEPAVKASIQEVTR